MYVANYHTQDLLGLTAVLVLQTSSCFSVPLSISLDSSTNQGVSVPRCDALSSVLFATTGQVVALAFLQPKRSIDFMSAAYRLAP